MARWRKTYQRVGGRLRVVEELVEDSDDERNNVVSNQGGQRSVVAEEGKSEDEEESNENNLQQPQNMHQEDQEDQGPHERQATPDQCSICYEAEPNFKTSCGHSFCQSCISNWRRSQQASVESRALARIYTCPLCRVALRDATTPVPTGRTRPRRRRRRENGNGEPRAPRAEREPRERARVRDAWARIPSRREVELPLSLLSTRVGRSQDGGIWMRFDDILFRDGDFRGGYVQADNRGRVNLNVPYYFAETLGEIQPIVNVRRNRI